MTANLSGAGRRAIAARIVDAYDSVAAGGSPVWISIEAPSGWGKTRIVQDVYARLAARQDDTGRYWPAALVDEASADLLRDRKAVAPAVVEREAGSLPSFFWWGISAFERSGIPSVALAQDLRQFDGHLPYLVARCTQLSRLRDKGSASARELARIALEEAGDELTSAVLDLAGLGIPGVGFVWRLGSWTAERISNARRERRIVAAGSTIHEDHSQIVDDAYETIQSVSRPGLPVVAVVEDLQYADATLIDLLARLMASGKPIIVLSTAWPGAFEASEALARLQAADTSLVRLSTALPTPQGWPAMRPLDRDDLAAIVREHHPHATDRTIDALVERSDNPLQLRIACTLPAVSRHASDGRLDLDPAVVAALPASLDAMYEQMWMQLPSAVRESLALALCGIPTDVARAVESGDDRWDAALLMRVARSLFPEAKGLVEAIDEAQTGYAWAELVGDALRAFPDEANRRIVEERRPEFYSLLDIERIRRELTRVIGDELDDPRRPEPVRQHRAALLLALSAEGFTVDADALSAAADVRTELLEAVEESDLVIEVIDHVSLALSDPAPAERGPAPPEREPEGAPAAAPVADPPRLTAASPSVRIAPMKPELRLRRAVALTRSGRWDEAEAELDEIIAHAELLGGADDPLALDGRIARASLELRHPRRSAEPDLGLNELQRAVERVFGPTDERILDLLRMRCELSLPTDVPGAPDIATASGRMSLDDIAARFGATHPVVIALHRLLAKEARDDGYPAAAADFLLATVDRLEAAVGTRHPEVLRLRLETARCLIDDARVDEAVALATGTHALLRTAAGPFDTDAVAALVVLATAEAAEPGSVADLDGEIRDVVAQYPSTIDQSPLVRLRAAHELMLLAAEDEVSDETIERLLDQLMAASDEVGMRDEIVMELRIATADALCEADHPEAAFVIAETAAWLCAPWAVRPRTWRAVMLLGRCHELLDRPAEASTAYAFVAGYADDARQAAERAGLPDDRTREIARRAEEALDRVQRASGSGWYPTEYVDVRPRDPHRPAERALAWGDDRFVPDDDELLRLAQHREGRALVYGPAEQTAWELSHALLRFRLNRGEDAEALAIARELLSFDRVPPYARSRWWTEIDWPLRTLILSAAVGAAVAVGQPGAALDLLHDASALAETNEQLAGVLGLTADLLEDLERTDDALDVLEELAAVSARIQDRSTLEEVFERRIRLLEDRDRHEEIVAAVRDALSSAPPGAWRTRLLTRLARGLDDVGRRGEALAAADDALAEASTPPARVSALRVRAWLRHADGDDGGSVEDLLALLEIAPDDRDGNVALVGPLVRLGLVDEATERYAAAVDASRAAGLDVSAFGFRLAVLRMVAAHGDPESAVTLAEEYLLLLDAAGLGAVDQTFRSLGEHALAEAQERLG